MVRNFLRDRNRFGLAPPPQWWLRALWEFDASLVVIPSRTEAVYRIAQRRRPVEIPIASHVHPHPDTAMLTSYGLVPVTTIVSVTGGWTWNATVFAQLAARCGWRQGLTPEQTAAAVDRAEADAKTKRRAARDDRLMHQLAWGDRVVKWHTGQRLLNPGLARSAQRAASAPSQSTHADTPQSTSVA